MTVESNHLLSENKKDKYCPEENYSDSKLKSKLVTFISSSTLSKPEITVSGTSIDFAYVMTSLSFLTSG